MDRHFVAETGPVVQGQRDYAAHSRAANLSERLVTDSTVDPVAATLGQIQFGQPTRDPNVSISGNVSYDASPLPKSDVGWTVVARNRDGRRQLPVLTIQIGGRDYSEQEAHELAASILMALEQARTFVHAARPE